jgi:hypothetical protein
MRLLRKKSGAAGFFSALEPAALGQYILMGPTANGNSSDVRRRLERAAAGDNAAWQDLLGPHQGRLRRMVALRLDPRLQGRIDPSDVLQETYLEAARHLAEYRTGYPLAEKAGNSGAFEGLLHK